MHNYIKLIKLVNSKEKGFTNKTIIYSILLGILPLLRLVAPKLIIDEFTGPSRLNVMFTIAIAALVLNFLSDMLKVKASQYLSLIHI